MNYVTERCKQLRELGMIFNGESYVGAGHFSDFNVHHTEVSCDTDEQWDAKIEALKQERANREQTLRTITLNISQAVNIILWVEHSSDRIRKKVYGYIKEKGLDPSELTGDEYRSAIELLSDTELENILLDIEY